MYEPAASKNADPVANLFRFREDVSAPDRRGYLWGTAVYAFGSTLLRAFAESGWLASIRGLRRDVEGGGLVTGLPAHPTQQRSIRRRLPRRSDFDARRACSGQRRL